MSASKMAMDFHQVSAARAVARAVKAAERHGLCLVIFDGNLLFAVDRDEIEALSGSEFDEADSDLVNRYCLGKVF